MVNAVGPLENRDVIERETEDDARIGRINHADLGALVVVGLPQVQAG